MPVPKKYIRLIFYIIGLLYVSSCKKDTPVSPVPDLGFQYFPLNLGYYTVYDVDSVVHDDFLDSVKPYKYQLKELVESKYTDNEGKETFRIERYKRANASDAWVIADVWAAQVSATRAEKFEENTWFLKMIFPVKINEKWNGNAFNSAEPMEYEYTEVHAPAVINGLDFDSTVTILQAEDVNAISKLFAKEMYAKNVGMIWREYINLDLQKDSGLVMTMKISSYGY